METGRTYNQLHVPRKYEAGKRRFSVYWTWSYPWESNADVTELDNRFSTMTEVRRVAWPAYETEAYSHRMFLQGISGTLELFHLSLLKFPDLARRGDGLSRRRLSACRSGRPKATDRRANSRRYRYADDLRPGSYGDRTGGRAGRDRRAQRTF